MFYLHDVAEGLNRSSANDENASSDDEGVLDEDCWEFGSAASSELEDERHQEPTSPRPHDGASSGVELAPPAFDLPSVVEAADSDPINTAPADEERVPPRGKSIAHFDLRDGNIVFLSLDLETGGEYCGIVQLSGQLFRQNMADKHHMTFIAVEDTFNEYVRPPDGAFWNEEACRQSHGLTAQSPQIRNGLPFTTVWTNFCTWIQENVAPSEKCILCAYCGETCDMRWIWKHCLAPRSQLTIPPQIVYFMDPLEVIKGYKCPLHPDKSKLDSLELGVVYQFVTGINLNGAHDSLVDVKAQTTVITSMQFCSYIDKSKSIRLVEDIFTAAEKRDMLKKMESLRPVHEPWFELVEGDGFTHTPPRTDRYTGVSGGADWGPSSEMLQLARGGDLPTMFLSIFTLSTLKFIAARTTDYAYNDWVVPTPRLDRDGNTTRRPIMSAIFPQRGETLPLNARHRCLVTKKKKKFKVTEHFILAWLGAVMTAGAYFNGDNNRGIDAIYSNASYGVSIPFIQNTMPQTAFVFLRNFIHFSRTKDQQSSGRRGYDPLFKVRSIINMLMERIRTVWIAGDRVTIDESMIRYMGRAIAFIQYMPRKPIKHGIKVFAVCCSYTGVLLGFEVYCGSSAVEGTDNSAVAVVDRLLKDNNLTNNCRGRILYTDNWYTTMSLAYHLYNKYGYFFCGTMVPTDKKAREDLDVPFLKLSNGAKDKVPRGWFREACIQRKTDTGKIFYIQHTTWKDRKQVCFLHTTEIGASSGHFVQRSGRGQQGRSTFAAPNSQRDYARHFNAVDRNDRDSADYTTSLRTNRWYLRVFFWLLDRCVHQLYVTMIYCAQNNIGPEEWSVYQKKHGRRRFQIDLGRDLMNYAIRNSWTNMDGPKPNWMRQSPPLPCECNKCFFCLNSLTTGIDHKRQKRTVTHFVQHDRTRTKTVGCTDKRVNLGKGTSYCKQCYRERTGTKEEKLDGIARPAMGCPSCDETICKKCWDKGYDMHRKKKP